MTRLTPQQREALLQLLRESAETREALQRLMRRAAQELDDARRDCPGCGRWLPREEFGRGRGLCRTCEAIRVRQYRARRQVA